MILYPWASLSLQCKTGEKNQKSVREEEQSVAPGYQSQGGAC